MSKIRPARDVPQLDPLIELLDERCRADLLSERWWVVPDLQPAGSSHRVKSKNLTG